MLTVEQHGPEALTEGLADALLRGERFGAEVFAAATGGLTGLRAIGERLARRGMELDFDDAADAWLARPCDEAPSPDPPDTGDPAVVSLAALLEDPAVSEVAKGRVRIIVENAVRMAERSGS